MNIFQKTKGKIQKWLENEGLPNRISWESILYFKKIFNFNNLHSKKIIKNYFDSNSIIKIQFGSGEDTLPGFLNTDLIGKIPVDITKKLPFKDNSVDLFYSNHTVEHIYHKDFDFFLKETFKKLKNNGIHIISTPSIEKINRLMYFSKDKYLKKEVLESFADPGEDITSAIFLNRIIHIRYLHKFLYDLETIKLLGKKHGYKNIYLVKGDKVLDPTITNKLKKRDPVARAITDTYVLIK
ncbi:MAG: methyltransferase domain-containing protein [Nanoarchaeota archaeon]|nr:methyltransferase domain-containing protein [Nanoarchaeota archaeon]